VAARFVDRLMGAELAGLRASARNSLGSAFLIMRSDDIGSFGLTKVAVSPGRLQWVFFVQTRSISQIGSPDSEIVCGVEYPGRRPF
jgi:hypothetical protein